MNRGGGHTSRNGAIVHVSKRSIMAEKKIPRVAIHRTMLTRKKAFARKVYVNAVQPTQPPVPLPGVRTSEATRVTMIPTNL